MLIAAPNATIHRRVGELDPRNGDASLDRTRDPLPPAMMADLMCGRVLIKNWHEFEPGTPEGLASARVVRAGQPETRIEEIVIADKVTSARGSRYYTPQAYEAAKTDPGFVVKSEETDDAGNVVRAEVRVTRWIESDTALVDRVLKEAGGRQNIMVINDEAHHAIAFRPSQMMTRPMRRMEKRRTRKTKRRAGRRRRSGSMASTKSPRSAGPICASISARHRTISGG